MAKKPMSRERAQEVQDTLVRFHKLERRATDDAGWVAFHYSISRAQGIRLLQEAKATLPDGWPGEKETP